MVKKQEDLGEYENISLVLSEAKEAILNNDPSKLKLLSDRTVHSATINQDSESIIVAVVIYSLGKILERDRYLKVSEEDNIFKDILKRLDSAASFAKKRDTTNLVNSLGAIRESITNLDGDLSNYIKDIFYKAGINKAFKLYEHGLSSEKTASLLGVSLWDLAGYIGQSYVSELKLNEAIPVRERIEKIRNISEIKNIILDSGPLISLTLTGTLFVLERIKRKFPEVEFIITPQVKSETIDKAKNVKKYGLEAIKLQTLLDNGVLKIASEYVSPNQLEKETSRILKITNSSYKSRGESLKLIQLGEASCLAFSNLCKCKNLIVVDERTVRLFSESPENLKTITEKKLHTPVSFNAKALGEFKDFSFVRSPELLFLAYEENLLDYKKELYVLDALLYGVKFSGASISSNEIEEMKSLVQ